jgi:DNA mismatch repair ATPase MutS
MSDKTNLNLDYQTIKELEIMYGEGSDLTLFDLLNRTVTPGGSELLRKRFRNPLCAREDILRRQESITCIMRRLEDWDLKVFKDLMDQVERYYYSKTEPVSSQHRMAIYLEGMIDVIRNRNFRKTIFDGTRITIVFISLLSNFLHRIPFDDLPSLLLEITGEMSHILESEPFSKIIQKGVDKGVSSAQLIYFDKLFREKHRAEVITLVSHVYELDVLISMARSCKEYGLVIPEIIDSGGPVLEVEGLYHLFLKNPVGNSTRFSSRSNFLFLTGPNMSGKTTFLKACGIAVFLAHLGMGVPATSMRISPFQCLFSSLNTTDNLSLGYSYFYSEVLRIKKAAESLRHHERSFMIFDELFKGTNVKDAYDGSILVVDGLMKWKSSLFILSSHLLELENAIRSYPNAFFQYFNSDVIAGKPVFTFGLHDGISNERLGLLILKNEKIDEILDPLSQVD